MNKVGRIVPPNKQILRDISLGFYYGAKIGVLGLNGAGKSTLLRIIAGIDKDYIGEISQAKGYTYGLLEQEHKLDETKTVIEVVREAVQPIVEMLAPNPLSEIDYLASIASLVRAKSTTLPRYPHQADSNPYHSNGDAVPKSHSGC